jgi:hypothetical protein
METIEVKTPYTVSLQSEQWDVKNIVSLKHLGLVGFQEAAHGHQRHFKNSDFVHMYSKTDEIQGINSRIIGNTDSYNKDMDSVPVGEMAIWRRGSEDVMVVSRPISTSIKDLFESSPKKGVGEDMNREDSNIHNKKFVLDFKLHEIVPTLKKYMHKEGKYEVGDIVITSKERYEKLLSYEEAIEEAVDEYMVELARERSEFETNIDLSNVIQELDLDIDEILQMVDEIEDVE